MALASLIMIKQILLISPRSAERGARSAERGARSAERGARSAEPLKGAAFIILIIFKRKFNKN
jgi:hypothetical protein